MNHINLTKVQSACCGYLLSYHHTTHYYKKPNLSVGVSLDKFWKLSTKGES